MAKLEKKAVRAAFNEACLTRDGHRCVICGATNIKLDVHHITPRDQMPRGGYIAENGVTLCAAGKDSCHTRAEMALKETEPDPIYGPSALYDKIGSSHERAMQADFVVLQEFWIELLKSRKSSV